MSPPQQRMVAEENGVKKMKQCIDQMLVILPFEKDYYKTKWNWEVGVNAATL